MSAVEPVTFTTLLQLRYFGKASDFDDEDLFVIDLDLLATTGYSVQDRIRHNVQVNTSVLERLGIDKHLYFFTSSTYNFHVHFYREVDAMLFKLGNS